MKAAVLKSFRYPFKAMGCPCEIQLFARDRMEANRVAKLAIADIERLEQKYSRYRSDSLLSAINRTATEGGRVTVDDETASLINYAETCYRQSDGLFDVTCGILRRAWQFDKGELPDQPQIASLLKNVGWHRLSWRPPELEFSPGMEIDFDGIVKEYAVDRVATLCWNAGVHHGIANLGGDVRIVGPRPDGTPWHIGIQHPRRKAAVIKSVALHTGSVASSGDYERCIMVEGVRYGHVLNPTTGWPVQHMASVSVVGDFCVVAGSASTIAMLKEEDGPEWLKGIGLPYYWVDVNGNTGGSITQESINMSVGAPPHQAR